MHLRIGMLTTIRPFCTSLSRYLLRSIKSTVMLIQLEHNMWIDKSMAIPTTASRLARNVRVVGAVYLGPSELGGV